MKKLILTLSLSTIALFGFSQTYDAGKQTSFASFTITDLTVDTINAVLQYQLNGTELGLMDNVIYVAMTSPVTSTGSFNAPYTSPNTALATANSGDIVVVAAGIYTEHITFIADSVTLISIGGKDVTFLSVVMVLNAGIDVVDYTTISGFTITGDAAGALIEINNDDNVKILNCLINSSGDPTFGISVGTSGCDSLLIQNNVFKTNSGDGAIWMEKNVTVPVVDHNYFYGADSTNGYAIQTAGTNGGQFTNNIIEGFASGIFPHTATSSSSGTSHITISGNIIKECSKAIRLGHSTQTVDMDSILVFDNLCYLNSWGIFIDNAATNLVNTFEIVDNTLNSNVLNYENIHSTLTPNSLSYWDGGNINIKGSFYNGSTEMLDLSDDVQVLFNPAADYTGTAAKPTLAFGDGNTGFWENSDNQLWMGAASSGVAVLSSTGLQSLSVSPGWSLRKATSTSTIPVYAFGNDFDTGVGTGGLDMLSLTAGGVEGIRVSEATKITVEVTDSLRVIGDGYLEADNIKVNDTIFADTVIIQGGAGLKRFKITLADDQSYAFEDATTQMVRILAIDQDAFINSGNIQSDGTVAVVGTGLISNTDSDGNACLFKSGTTVIFRNRLGSEVSYVIEILKP